MCNIFHSKIINTFKLKIINNNEKMEVGLMFQNSNLNPDYLKKINLKYQLTLRGKDLLDNGDYLEAVDFFKKLLKHELFINDYHPYTKLANAYHRLRDYESEVETIRSFFNSGRYCQRTTLRWFKRRLENLSDMNKFDITEIDVFETLFEENGSQNIDKSRIPVPLAYDIKKTIEKSGTDKQIFDNEFFDYYVKFDDNESLEYKIKFKHKLFKKGEELIANHDYSKAIIFFKRLLGHDLFINDYYPHQRLSQVLRKTGQENDETKIIISFFNSGIYCNNKHLSWFINRLKELSDLGFYNSSKIPELQNAFNKNGALNEQLSKLPVPSAIKIKNTFELMDKSYDVDENGILGILVDEIPSEYLNKLPNQQSIINNNLNEYEEEMYFTSNIDNIDLIERKQMIVVLQLLNDGISRSDASKIANCSTTKIYGWYDDGKNKKNANSIYFYTQSNKIENSKLLDSERIEHVEIDNETFLNNNNLNMEEKLIEEFNSYIKSSYFKIDSGEYMLSYEDIEEIKNKIIDDILLHNIKGEVDFKEILIGHCQNFHNYNPKLSDEEFDEIFSKVDVKNLDGIDEIRQKTIDEYNLNKIDKDSLESRFKYHIQRKVRQINQLSRLEDIKNNPNVPETKINLSQEELTEIYKKTENKILSEHGLNGIVLDYVRFNIDNLYKNNKSKSHLKLNKLMDDGLLSDVDYNQKGYFIDKIKNYIDRGKIKNDDITSD